MSTVFRRFARWAPVALAVLGVWFLLAPPGLGGSTTLSVVAGPSMQPTFDSGDLVVARSQGTYSAGDVVVLQATHGNVVHRIIDGTGAIGYVTQGDNNPDPDPWVTTDDQVLGRVAVHIPDLGRYLLIARAVLVTPPFPYALAAFVFLTIVLGGRRGTGSSAANGGWTANPARDSVGCPEPTPSEDARYGSSSG